MNAYVLVIVAVHIIVGVESVDLHAVNEHYSITKCSISLNSRAKLEKS